MSYTHLTTEERNVIWRMKRSGKTMAEIARCLGRHRSTISRELRRNREYTGDYWPDGASVKARIRRRAHIRRPKTGSTLLMRYVGEKLEQRWSPEQIAGRLRAVGTSQVPGLTVSHTTIYRWIWGDRTRAQHFRPFLRIAHKPRRKPYGRPSQRGQIPGRVSIDLRPDVVDRRVRLGDWEVDTLVGKARSGYVLAGVERQSRYTVARRIDAPAADIVAAALHHALGRLPPDKRKTGTVDNGREFAAHADITRRLGLAIYFAHPYSAWERGTGENTNGLLRQYLPKKMSLEDLTPRALRRYLKQLNNRPRKCLNYRTPVEVFFEHPVALTM